jgi:D-alanine-D-alanine ligase
MMPRDSRRTDLAVLLLHNLDPDWESAEIADVTKEVAAMKSALQKEGHRVVELPVTGRDLSALLAPFDPSDYVVFNWCEELPGVAHSEVQVAEILEAQRFTFTGSTAPVLSLSWDKAAVKALLQQAGIATPNWRIFSSSKSADWKNYPAIVKPAFEHCSNGITSESIVVNGQELCARIDYVLEHFRQPALVEDFIDGREFHVTLWGNGHITMLPPAEMDFSALDSLRDRLCTFDAKFSPGSLHYEKIELRIPAPLNDWQTRLLKKAALESYRVVGCRDYARIDVRLRDGIFHVLDVNPNADLSPDTSMAYAAEAAGMTYGGLCSTLVNLAAQRHPLWGEQPSQQASAPAISASRRPRYRR